MKKRFNLAMDVINAFMQWFIYHNLPIDRNISEKLDRLSEVEE